MLNPGTTTAAGYYAIADLVCSYESAIESYRCVRLLWPSWLWCTYEQLQLARYDYDSEAISHHSQYLIVDRTLSPNCTHHRQRLRQRLPH